MSADDTAKTADALRERAEALLAASPTTSHPSDLKTVRELLQELAVHQSELELQNEELRETQFALESVRDRFAALFEHAPAGYVVLDESGIIRQTNATWRVMLKQEEDDFRGLPFVQAIISEDAPIFLARFRAFFRNPAEKEIVVRIKRKGAPPFHARIEARPRTLHAEASPAADIPRTELLVIVSDITETREAEEEIRRNAERLKAVVEILQYPGDNIQDFLDTALNKAIDLTHSRIGYIYFYDEEHREFILNTWSKDVMKECAVANPQTRYELDKTGIWGEAVRQRKPILINDFEADNPLKRGYPEGHVHLRRFLTVPILNNDRIVAVVGVANKSSDYTETDMLELTLLMDSVWKSVEAIKSDERIALLGEMLDEAPASITIHDTQGRFMFANRATLSLHGFDRLDEFMAVNLHDLDVPEAEALLAERFRKIAETGEARFEVAHFRKDGSTFPLEVSAKAIQWRGQHAVLSIAVDITKRKRAEEALRDSEERNRLLSDVTLEGIVIHKNAVAMDLNASMAKMLGFDREELIGTDFMKFIHENDRAVVRSNIIIDVASPYTIRMMRRDGDYFFAEIESRNFERQGDVWRVSAIRDITERKRAEAEQEKLHAQLIQAQKMESVGRLAGGVAHDFNNMLAVILGQTEMALMQLTPDAPLHRKLLQIQKSAERSTQIVRQLLAFARKQTVAPRVLDLNATVQGMLSMLGRLIGEDIRLTWLPGSDLWPVRMDPSQIDQILANLCVNARDAIANTGTISIETRNMVLDTDYCAHNADCVPGEYLLLSVSDDGCGMEKEVIARLFEPFFTTKEVGKGTGLGLATVYGIVRQNKGFVTVYSEPGRGTSFRIYLPRHTGDEDQNRSIVEGNPIQRGHETIMLVEDEPMLVDIGKAMMERLGYDVLAAGTPEEAVRLADQHAGKIDLLITDVILPGMNGRELSERLLQVYPNLKCLFMSGYTADVIAHHGVLDPDVHFIQKPFTLQALSAKLREVLGLAGGD